MAEVLLTLLVLKTRQVEQLRRFYQRVGVGLAEECLAPEALELVQLLQAEELQVALHGKFLDDSLWRGHLWFSSFHTARGRGFATVADRSIVLHHPEFLESSQQADDVPVLEHRRKVPFAESLLANVGRE